MPGNTGGARQGHTVVDGVREGRVAADAVVELSRGPCVAHRRHELLHQQGHREGPPAGVA